MKKWITSWLVLLALLNGSASIQAQEKLEFDLTKWYDEDRDGVMEFPQWVSYYQCNLYKMIGKEFIKHKDFPFEEEVVFNAKKEIFPYNLFNNKIGYYSVGYNTEAEAYQLMACSMDENNQYQLIILSENIGNNKVIPCDYNSDGLTDFLLVNSLSRDYEILIQNRNGSFISRKLNVMSQEEFTNRGSYNYLWEQSAGSGGFVISNFDELSLRNGMFVGGEDYAGVINGQMTDFDFNKDGLPDLLNTLTGEILINAGNEEYIRMPMGGMIYFRDLNNNQRLDYIIYNPTTKTVTSYIEQMDGSIKEQLLIKNLSMDSQIWCYDIDKDGDVDIILPFSYSDKNRASFLVVMENDGNGNFKMHENYYDEKYEFVTCTDIDNDGYYEVIAKNVYDRYGISYPDVFQLRSDGKLKFMARQEPLLRLSDEECYNYIVQVADINSDGIPEIMAYVNASPRIEKVYSLSGVTSNTPPNKPEKPSCIFDPVGGYLKVSWKQGTDKESSSVDLTYALRIGTEPGKGDILFAHADENGRRLNLLDGNMGYNLDKVLDVSGWNCGKYYIAVQTIDPMHMGSQWSEEVVFEKTQPNSGFFLTGKNTVADTLTLALADKPDSNLQYNWNMGDATIISVNEDKSIYKIQFTTPGEKRISLQTVDKQGSISKLTEKVIDIFGNKITGSHQGDFGYVLDLDCDGFPELLTSNGVYENIGDGKFEKVKKIYNTDLSFYTDEYRNKLPVLITDCNKNGMADIVQIYSEYPNYYIDHYINSGDKILSVNSYKDKDKLSDYICNYSYCPSHFVDFTNNGNTDIYNYNGVLGNDITAILRNTGDNINFIECKIDRSRYSSLFPVDINKNGFFDLFSNQIQLNETNESIVIVYINNGDATFVEKEIPTEISINNDYGYIDIAAIADMNNDGYQDLIIQKNENTIIIAINDQNNAFYELKEFVLPVNIEGMTVGKIFDFDNNGYLDIVLGKDLYHKYGNYILYFYDDWQTKFQRYDDEYDDVINKARLIDNRYVSADLNNNGVPSFVMEIEGIWMISNQSTITNTRPEAPKHLRATQQDEYLLLEWDPAKDAETPYVQMRYNVSVKKKGAEGDGAFIISPLNGLNDKASIVPSYFYKTATRMPIPLSALPAGTYEAQIQSIDGWNAPSKFSEVLTFTVESSPQMKLPEYACAGSSVLIEYKGTMDGTDPAWNWDGGKLLHKEGRNYEVVWDAEGMKNISVTIDGVTKSAQLYVSPAINTDFTIPAYVMKNSYCPVILPEGNYTFNWMVSVNGGAFRKLTEPGNPFYIAPPVRVHQNTSSGETKAIFTEEGTYVLRLTVETNCGSQSSDRTIVVSNQADQLSINLVTADASTGKNKITWTVPGGLPAFITGINIYKEGSRYNDFNLIATLPLTETHYVDMASNPQTGSARYRLTLQTAYGTESAPCEAHQSVHTMINKGMGKNSWNLLWSKYEGATIESYRILRGTSPDNMAVIAEVSGNSVSYSDATAPEGELYYALEFSTTAGQAGASQRSAGRQVDNARSNVVSTAGAAGVIFGEEIYIRILEDEVVLDGLGSTLHFAADIYPLTATYRNVNWSIISGEEIARINQQGVLTTTGKEDGTVIVRASTVDGSQIYRDIEVKASNTTGVEEVIINHPHVDFSFSPSVVVNELHIKNIPEVQNGTIVFIAGMNGQIMHQERVQGAETSVACNSYPSGIYIIKLINENGVMSKKFIKK